MSESEQGSAGGRKPSGGDSKPTGDACAPVWVVVIAVTWFLLLAASFVVYLVSASFRHALPSTIGTKIPVTVLWFGALGGWVISFTGIIEHGVGDWKARFNLWHPARPVLGAVMGSIGCVLLLVTTDVSTKGPIHTDTVFYDGVSFVLGYAEQSFRQLIKRVTDVIIGPGSTKTGSDDDASTLHQA